MPWYLLSQPYLPRHQPPGHNVQVSSNASAGSNVPNTLLMTCQVQIQAPDSTSVKARALLDSESTMSFVSERIVQSLGLRLTVSGIGGMSTKSSQSFVSPLQVSSLYSPEVKYKITATVVPRVTCDLPLQLAHNHSNWSHLSMLPLADPDFALPGRIDLLMGADLYADVMLHGRRCGPLALPQPSKQVLVGFSLEKPTATLIQQIKRRLLPFTLPSHPAMTHFACSGK